MSVLQLIKKLYEHNLEVTLDMATISPTSEASSDGYIMLHYVIRDKSGPDLWSNYSALVNMVGAL